MRTFFLLTVLAIASLWGARQVRGDEPPMRVLRWALYIAAGLFAGLLLSAMLQVLFAGG
jgi:hypothetical protein